MVVTVAGRVASVIEDKAKAACSIVSILVPVIETSALDD